MGTPSLVQRTIHAATHPVSSAAYVVGVVRGTAAALLRAAAGSGGPAAAEWRPTPEPLPDEAVETPESEIVRDLAAAPDPVAEDLADRYDDEPGLDATAEGVIEALRQGDHGPPVDEGELKAIISESETLRRAADVDKG
ncbi:MAG: hypothetical protein J7518_20655 [Nocardioidaceae bacterium]|nr:hypothetical protein [Nocardioidaceae bacterium]